MPRSTDGGAVGAACYARRPGIELALMPMDVFLAAFLESRGYEFSSSTNRPVAMRVLVTLTANMTSH